MIRSQLKMRDCLSALSRLLSERNAYLMESIIRNSLPNLIQLNHITVERRWRKTSKRLRRKTFNLSINSKTLMSCKLFKSLNTSLAVKKALGLLLIGNWNLTSAKRQVLKGTSLVWTVPPWVVVVVPRFISQACARAINTNSLQWERTSIVQ